MKTVLEWLSSVEAFSDSEGVPVAMFPRRYPVESYVLVP
jgi:hypothetical protein